MKKWIVAIVLAVIAIAPMFYLAYYFGGLDKGPSDSPTMIEFQSRNTKLETGAEIEVIACRVADGYRYQLFLAGDQWIEAHLAVAAKEGAVEFVVETLKETTVPPPTVLLKRKVGDFWIVDFNLTVNERRVTMTGLLGEKDLLLH
jgi:hypothetical protein